MLMEPFFSSPTPLGASLMWNQWMEWAGLLGCVPEETKEACFFIMRGGIDLCVCVCVINMLANVLCMYICMSVLTWAPSSLTCHSTF